MSMVNAFNPDAMDKLSDNERAMIARRQKVLGPAYRLFYERPVHLVRGEGVHLYDASGNAYLDAYNNVASVGHCHPHVVAAIARQAATLNTHTRYLQDDILTFAERLLATFPAALGQVMFTCTGSEANDLALRIARAHTGHDGVIVTALAYHGVTESVAEMSPSLGAGVDLGARIRTVPAPDSYRGDPDVAARFAQNIKAAIAEMADSGLQPAALIVDGIFSSDGIFADPPGFLKPAVEAIRAAGGLFIADEVQPGFGRLGESLWGFARHGIIPDIVTLGKPMGNGHPVAAMVCKPEILAAFGARARYFNTFGGNPVSIAAASAVMDVIEQDHLVANAKSVGAALLSGCRHLQQRFTAIGDVRGIGLFVGVDFVCDCKTKAPNAALATHVVNALREKHILISASGPGANVLKIRPPLPFSHANADQLLTTFEAVLHATPAHLLKAT
jgi:4-aminobutyrate aminotransferase-like enzyme